MYRLHVEVIVLSALLSTCCGASQDAISTDLVNYKVHRTVELATHLPKVTSVITLENTGKTAVKSFLYAVDPAFADHVAYIGALTKHGDDEEKLEVAKTTVTGHQDVLFYRIGLAAALEAGKQVTVELEVVYSHALRPYPSHITQADKQYVQYVGNLFHYSPYATRWQTTIVNAASTNIESYTKTSPVKVSESVITYGPHEDKPEFSQAEMTIHYENNSPFLTVTQLTRLIELSHWGNIAIEETVDVLHSGAVLKGPFSRYDYQRTQETLSSIKTFKTVLPAAARDVYYRDEIGNISTSNLRELDDMVEVELRPRFPLFGGWKTHYMLGYNVPSYQYLFNKDDKYVLKMRFVDHIYDDQVIDQMTVKVILPEGVTKVTFKAPYAVERDADELFFTYLDTMGRHVVTAHKADLTEQHIQDFELHYTFQRAWLLQEPLLVVSAFYLLFIVIIIYVRLDFSITKDEASESRMRVASLIEQIQSMQDRRSALYQSYEDAINKYKSSKDANAFNTNRKRIDTDYKQLTQQINALLSKLKTEGSDVADKVQELQRHDGQMRDQNTLAIQYAEKLISGKMSKSQYLEVEGAVTARKDELSLKMETLLTTL